MLKEFIIKILLGKLSIQSQKRIVFLGRISKRKRIFRHILSTILTHLLHRLIVVLLRSLVLSHHMLHH